MAATVSLCVHRHHLVNVGLYFLCPSWLQWPWLSWHFNGNPTLNAALSQKTRNSKSLRQSWWVLTEGTKARCRLCTVSLAGYNNRRVKALLGGWEWSKLQLKRKRAISWEGWWGAHPSWKEECISRRETNMERMFGAKLWNYDCYSQNTSQKKRQVCYPQRKMIKVDVLGEKLFVASVTKTAWNWEELQNILTSTAWNRNK